jgi:lipopolysaccharide heptosyltransferase I
MINGVPRILIIRLSAIGDVVRVLPALHALREKHPNAQIDWAVEPKSAGIIEGHPALDRVLIFDRPPGSMTAAKSFWRFCRQVRKNHYDLVVDFHGILKSGLITAASRAPERYGFAPPRSQELSYLFTNRKARLHAKDLNRTEENLILCDLLCPRRDSLDVTIHVPPDVQEEVDAYFENTFEGGKLVVAMHVPVDRPEKQWPIEHFARLADLLLSDGRFEVLLTWGPGQFEVVEQVVAAARRNPVVAPETADLKHCTWLLHRAALFVGGDTGPMHIAAAMGTPVVAIFGGTDPAKHAPYHRTCEILHGTGGKNPETAQDQLRQITPDVVYDACVRLVMK